MSIGRLIRIASDSLCLVAFTLGVLSFASDSRADAPILPPQACTACLNVGDPCIGNMMICGHALAPPNYTYTLYPCRCCVCSLDEGGGIGCDRGQPNTGSCGDTC